MPGHFNSEVEMYDEEVEQVRVSGIAKDPLAAVEKEPKEGSEALGQD